MLVKRKITLVHEHQRFYYAGRTYVLANAEERRKHPAAGTNGVLAYHVLDKGDRVPVSFNATSTVYVRQK